MHKVAIITRTRNRPLLLKRAVASVAGQSMKDFLWVIVNDGGDPIPAENAASAARQKGVNAEIINLDHSRGMEAASNAGIGAAACEYVAIHDDDDSWEMGFLKETTAFMEANPSYVGVVTQAMRISEQLQGERIVTLKRTRHAPVLQSVHLADMARGNLFPPIAFLYRRSLFRRLRGYDESMQVLGDWDFNLRALLIGDIGVIPKCLANYHVRPSQAHAGTAYANSISPQTSVQLAADAAYRNRWIRKDIKTGKAGLGTLLAIGRIQKHSNRPGQMMASAASWWNLVMGKGGRNRKDKES